MANQPFKKLWRNQDNSDCTNSFSWDSEMKTSLRYSRQNCTQRAPLHCAERSREDLKRPFKYFSFAKQALAAKETKGNWDDLGLIFLGDGISFGSHSSLPNSSLNRQSNTSLISLSLVVWFQAQVPWEASPLAHQGVLAFLPLKRNGLFIQWHAQDDSSGENGVWSGPVQERRGAFISAKSSWSSLF